MSFRFAMRSLVQGLAGLAVVAAVYLWHAMHGASTELTRTNTLLMLLVVNICLVLSHRSLVPSLPFSSGRRNPALGWGLLIAAPALAGIFTWPGARDLLGLAAPDLPALLTCLVGGAALWAVLQITKKGMS
jgi:hypothetical protein